MTCSRLGRALANFYDDVTVCRYCNSNLANVIVLECNHLSLCRDCVVDCLRCPQCNLTIVKYAIKLVKIETNYRTLLEKETQNLQTHLYCIICQKKLRNVLFMNCYHVVVCTTCMPEVRQCPICLTPQSLNTIKEVYY